MSKSILVITNNLKQASFRLRIAALMEPLRQRGFDLDVQVRPRSLLARRQLLRSAGQYDSVILQRKLLDRIDARRLRAHARGRIFYDVDDAIMFDERPHGRLSQWRTRRRFRATAAIVDRVAAGNEYLADVFRLQGCICDLVPTVLDPQRYLVKTHAPGDSITLAWIGSHSTLSYLAEILPEIERAAERIRGLRLLIIADQALSSDRIPIEHIEWSEATEAQSLIRGDIGIAPTPLNPWTMGKCGFKILQYMAAGLPVIASPVGANASIVLDDQTGLLPNDAHEWADALAKLAGDAALRQRMGQAGRARVESHYSTQVAVDAWSRILES
jgi:glycosyltransferase involved in cell wall biosynthesis